MIRAVLLVLGKELRSTVRDPHVLAYLLFPIVLYPAIILGTVAVMSYRDGLYEAASWRVGIDAPPEVAEVLLRGNEGSEPDVEALARNELDVVVHARFEGDRVVAEVDRISTRARSMAAADQVAKRLRGIRDRRMDAKLAELGLTEADMKRVVVRREERKDAGQITQWFAALLLGAVVPVAMLIAGVYPTVEMVVSEREKGTMETTLVAPVSRVALLGGKVLAAMSLMVGAGLGNATALALTANQLVYLITDELSALWIPPPTVLLGVPAIASCAVLFAGTNLLVVLPARTFKEGEYVATVGMTLLTAPILAGLFAVITGNDHAGWLFVPVANAVIGLYKALQGRVDLVWSIVPALLNGALGAVLIVVAARLLDREETLFGDRLPAWLAWMRRLIAE